MASLPIDPRLSRMLIEAKKEGCTAEILVLAAALSIADPRERPAEQAEEADAAHRGFHHPSSDFLTYLELWRAFGEARRSMGSGRLKRFCRERFVSFVRMREWRDLHAQLKEEAIEAGLADEKKKRKVADDPDKTKYGAVHRSILSGFLSGIGVRKERWFYRTARDREAMLFPGSALFEDPPEWIVAAEMVETSRLFARTAARIDRRWLEALGGDLCRHTYLNPRWDKKRGRVTASEQVRLFGLVIVEARAVSYGKIAPAEASDIFVQGALVEGQVKRPFAFMDHNRALIERIRKMEDKIRRRDLLVSDPEIFAFYRDRIPGPISDIRAFSRFLKEQGGDRFLRMNEEDVLARPPDTAALARYPDRIDVGSRRLPVDYRFTPGSAEDGVTLKIPAAEVSEVAAEPLEWLVPGLLREKITALIRGLPKAYRRHLVPVADTVEEVVGEMREGQGALLTALADAIHRRFGLEIPATAWPVEELPDHLKMRISVVGPHGEELRAGRDHSILSKGAEEKITHDALDAARKKWEKSGLEDWDFGDLPETISLGTENAPTWQAFPGLKSRGDGGVDLVLFTDRRRAVEEHRAGVAALYRKRYAKDLKFFRRQISISGAAAKKAVVLGGAAALEEQIFERVFNDLFAENIRSAEAFAAHRESAAGALFEDGQALLAAVLPVVEAVFEARSMLSELEEANRERPAMAAFLEEIRNELAGLVPEHFIGLYGIGRLAHLPRYVKALSLRAQRGVDHLEKDRAKADAVRPFSRALQEIIDSLSPAATGEKRIAVEDFFWLLQEYRVSVFAQELGTDVPVSKKKLEKRLSEVRRMA
jgi:ATP-dependent helicase HrpA